MKISTIHLAISKRVMEKTSSLKQIINNRISKEVESNMTEIFGYTMFDRGAKWMNAPVNVKEYYRIAVRVIQEYRAHK